MNNQDNPPALARNADCAGRTTSYIMGSDNDPETSPSGIPAMNRRHFLRTGSAATGSAVLFPTIVPRTVLAADGSAPNSRIRMAIIGLGGISGGHTGSFAGNARTEIAVVCDVDRNRWAARKKTVNGAMAKRTGQKDFDGCETSSDYREVLARTDIDAVAVCTPDHWHVPICIAAAKAGKDIYCEKPLTLTITEGRRLVDTVKRYGRVLQVGSQQRSGRNFRFACELVRNGRIGELQSIETRIGTAPSGGDAAPSPVPDGFDYDFWLGRAPAAPYTKSRCHGTFRWVFDYSGGKMTDWGAHHNDIAQWGNGTELTGPVSVEGTGEFPSHGLFNVATEFRVEYTYANGVKLVCRNDGQNGIQFQGTEGWVFVSRGRLDANPKSLLQSVIGPEEIHLYESGDHRNNFLDCIFSRRDPIASAEIGHRSATVCHLGNIAMRTGRKLMWDPEAEQFVGDAQANRFLDRAPRDRYAL